MQIEMRIKQWLIRKLREWITEAIGYDAILVGSEIRMLRADVRCLKDNHDWSNWCAYLSSNIQQMNEDRYSYRACQHCHLEMPDSRIYHETGKREVNAMTYEEHKKKYEIPQF